MLSKFPRTVLALSILLPLSSAIPSQGDFIGIITYSANFSRNITEMTLPQCYSFYSTNDAPHHKWDVVTSILTWVVPLFVLVGNMHFSYFHVGIYKPEDDRMWWHAVRRHVVNTSRSVLSNYAFIILHLLADPMDTIWSLLDKLAAEKGIRSTLRQQLETKSTTATSVSTAKGYVGIIIRHISHQLSTKESAKPMVSPIDLQNLTIILLALDASPQQNHFPASTRPSLPCSKTPPQS
jgi:hypothetical protein